MAYSAGTSLWSTILEKSVGLLFYEGLRSKGLLPYYAVTPLSTEEAEFVLPKRGWRHVPILHTLILSSTHSRSY